MEIRVSDWRVQVAETGGGEGGDKKEEVRVKRP